MYCGVNRNLVLLSGKSGKVLVLRVTDWINKMAEINGHEEITGEEIDFDFDRMRDEGYKLDREQNKERLKGGLK